MTDKEATMNSIFESCTLLGRFLESYGAKPIWAPTKLRKNHARVTVDGVVCDAGKKLLIGIIPDEGDQWTSLRLVGDDQTFRELRHRPFYAPSTLWYEFNVGSDRAQARFSEFEKTLLSLMEESGGCHLEPIV